jgi:CheY-like chemotaxis protein
MTPTKKVLVVEDDADIRDMIRDMLISNGISVLTANDGVEGLALYNQHSPKLVMADVRMPNKDGFQMAEAIKEINHKTPIILFSGQYPDLLWDKMDNKLKCDHVLFKPLQKSDILESVTLFLDDNFSL